MTGERAAQNGPFCWQGKAELRRLADSCEGRTDRAYVLAVYVALSWIASDRQTETFSEPIGRIAERAGVSYRKCEDVLALLNRIGLVNVASNVIPGTKERAPNTYTLRTVCATSGTECLRLGTAVFSPCRDYKKNLQKNPKKAQGAEVSLPDVLQTEDFRSKWNEYEAYRREAKLRALKPASIAKQIKQLAEWGHAAAIESIDATIRNGWQGLFEPKGRSAGSTSGTRDEAPLKLIEP